MNIGDMRMGTNNGPYKVVFATFKAGYDSEKKTMEELMFEVGKTYTATRVVVGGWSTDVYLEEFPNRSFNSVFFKRLEDYNA